MEGIQVSTRNPVIIDRGAARNFDRFLCATRNDSITWYVGATAETAYIYWTKNTNAGRWHAHRKGFAAIKAIKVKTS